MREGDSGAPIFLSDGRVGGVVTEINFGLYSAGIKVTSASDIVKWLIDVFGSYESLKDPANSIEAWTANKNIYDSFDPQMCPFSNSCVSSVRIALELQPTNLMKLDTFTREQLNRCPVFVAALNRDIRPHVAYLQKKLEERGLSVDEQINKFAKRALFEGAKYSTYTKVAALELIEARLATQLDSLWKDDPTAIARGLCEGGLKADQIEAVQVTLDNYLANFRQAGATEARDRSAECPAGRYKDSGSLERVQVLSKEISGLKSMQASLVKEMGGLSDNSAAATAAAVAALLNLTASQIS